jgi:protein-L-isoaspartate O-methyltransferase
VAAAELTRREHRMLDALELRSGDNVLVVGAGVSPLTQRIEQITGRTVLCTATSDADRARGAADECGTEVGVDDPRDDGYSAPPGCGQVDQIVVTRGIAGVPPGWRDVLAPAGRIVAPIAHAGRYPLMVAGHSSDNPNEMRACVIGVEDVPDAAGRLRPARLFYDPVLSGLGRDEAGTTGLSLLGREYESLCFFLGVSSEHITRAIADDANFDPESGDCVLVDPRDFAAAWLHRDGTMSSTAGDDLPRQLAALACAWADQGRPDIREWSCVLREVRGTGLMLPTHWTHCSDSGPAQDRGIGERSPLGRSSAGDRGSYGL